ncbi:ATP-dependent helicase [Patescibacteria group bacterium]|nr:MAG: ATP-dependent helicase [Patescibacteria group bacterium]
MDIGSFNPVQRQAVEHGEGPALIVAGAGTGKTHVITSRIAYLIEQGKASPGQILALTFTEKAAREMAERLYDLIGWRSYQVAVMTFHAFGSELLGRYANHIGRSVRGGLINTTQKALLLQQHIDRVELSYYGPHANIFEFLEGLVEHMGMLQNAGISPSDYAAYAEKLTKDPGDMHAQDVAEQQDLAKLYSLYEQIKAETGTFDYNDQLQIPLNILQQRPNLAARLSKEYKYVLVDEYQDTNTLQDELLRSFIGPTGNLFAVGDDDQAIYGFRGAQIDNILSFVDHFKVKQPLVLTDNYRSGQEILDGAYRLIQHNNPERLEAKLHLKKQLKGQFEGSQVEFKPYSSASEELAGVTEAIQARVTAGESPGGIAVLSATHAPLKQLAKSLRQRQLPFALSTQVNIFEQPELNQLWYLLQWVGLKAEDDSIGHVLMGDHFGWTAGRYRELLSDSREQMTTVEAALVASDQDDAKKVLDDLEEWRQLARSVPVSQLAYTLIFKTGVSDTWIKRAEDSPRMVRVFEDLGRLLEQMQDYETVATDPTLKGYLGTFPKPPSIEVAEPLGEEGGVQLLTVHASKGLEFDTVYLIGCTQRNWSPSRGRGWVIPEALTPATELPPEHELRRLMYVAVTRAKQQLILSSATQTASGTRQTISPFIEELLGQKPAIAQSEKNPSKSAKTAMSKLQRFYPLQHQAPDKLPFETDDGWLELGVNDLGGYDFCPYDFYLEKVLGIRAPYGPQLALGTAVHTVIQAWYQGKLKGEEVPLADLLARLDELWSDRGYGSQAQSEQARQQAQAAIKHFFTRERQESDRVILGSELPIKLEIPEAKLRLKGRIDAYFKTSAGVQLRDFKTGRKNDAEKLAKSAKNNFQLRTYAVAYQQMTGEAPSSVALDYVMTQTEGVAELSSTILNNHRDKLIKLSAAIRQRQFAPNPSNVHECAAIRYYGVGEAEEADNS